MIAFYNLICSGENKTNEWVADKSGLKICNLIVDPILKKVSEILNDYIKNYGTKIKDVKIDVSSAACIYTKLITANKISHDIIKNNLHKDILRYIAPSFGIDTKAITNDVFNSESITNDNDCDSSSESSL